MCKVVIKMFCCLSLVVSPLVLLYMVLSFNILSFHPFIQVCVLNNYYMPGTMLDARSENDKRDIQIYMKFI